MDSSKVAYFVSQYNSLNEDELLDIDRRRPTLADEARVALDQVVAERGVNLAGLRTIAAKKELLQEQHERELEAKKYEKSSKDTKYFLIVAVPLVVIGLVFNTGRAYEAVVAAFVQVGVLTLAYWGYLKYKRSKAKRKG